MRIIVSTQVRENYGAHDWDGKGTCPQYWKNKSGSDYVIADLTIDDITQIANSGNSLDDVVSHLIDVYSDEIEEDNDYYYEFVIGWELLEENELTEFEKFQVEYYTGSDCDSLRPARSLHTDGPYSPIGWDRDLLGAACRRHYEDMEAEYGEAA